MRGFTLLEVVLATALLAAGLVLAYATLRTATGSVQRAEDIAARTDRVRAAQGFLRRQLQSAMPMPFERDADTGVATVFRGSRDEVEFVAPMPGFLARGGPQLQRLRIVRDGDALRLEFDHRMLLGDRIVEDPDARPPEVLLAGIADARFEFRGLDDEGALTDWSDDDWELRAQLPVMLRLRLEFAGAQRWPDLEIPMLLRGDGALPMSASMQGQP
ncbi:prepilin-type N-terminal cleavage/methylation domain-containing protein [Coralloluteibacterium stylophorae]|uniref:Prepilin-type N-terminal cleavage/methylation domain-containing protein n=1 Tax=Coralloluteibacterium stylophorae TaxID=1776034 RepID=A0A8J7VRU8_9GAMM|nr:prepilin-type N-terminal cleavage/methylation domain-containing protein [Coralloluteibacterium stylophorae]MBS7457777.1 prepilin-type N-terminal cleavage/methylation domain-containing protein [Coralloluteibacterium stylophorae]